jgi:hypothetical protein
MREVNNPVFVRFSSAGSINGRPAEHSGVLVFLGFALPEHENRRREK